MWARCLVFAVAWIAMAACASSSAPAAAPFHVSSVELKEGVFPKSATCNGGDHRPTLSWTKAPSGTKGFVIELIDSDAPGGTFTHWLLYNIPAATTQIGQALPKGSVQGYNEFGKRAYSGPCPPSGQLHHYHIYVVALDQDLHIPAPVDRFNLEAALHGHVLGKAELVATYKH
jgi:Raf kinase inhibitor-like YbhB/YbcL family protein